MVSEAARASKQPLWPQRSNLTSELKSATSITMVSMCMLLLTTILVVSEAMVASKRPQWPQSSNLTSHLKSATLITLVSLCMLPLTPILVALGHGSLQTASEVTSGLIIKLSDLNYPCSHAYLASRAKSNGNGNEKIYHPLTGVPLPHVKI